MFEKRSSTSLTPSLAGPANEQGRVAHVPNPQIGAFLMLIIQGWDWMSRDMEVQVDPMSCGCMYAREPKAGGRWKKWHVTKEGEQCLSVRLKAARHWIALGWLARHYVVASETFIGIRLLIDKEIWLCSDGARTKLLRLYGRTFWVRKGKAPKPETHTHALARPPLHSPNTCSRSQFHIHTTGHAPQYVPDYKALLIPELWIVL